MDIREFREKLKKVDILLEVDESEYGITAINCRGSEEPIIWNIKNSPTIRESENSLGIVSIDTLHDITELMMEYVMTQRGYVVKKELFQFKFYCSFIKRNEVFSYLNYNAVNKEFFLDDKRIVGDCGVESVFSQEDIKKFPQDIQDMIEIGVLTKEEVE